MIVCEQLCVFNMLLSMLLLPRFILPPISSVLSCQLVVGVNLHGGSCSIPLWKISKHVLIQFYQSTNDQVIRALRILPLMPLIKCQLHSKVQQEMELLEWFEIHCRTLYGPMH